MATEYHQLSADTVDGFVQKMLLPNFDDPCPTPRFHRTMWGMCCDKEKQVAMAAPRDHGKSSAVTLSYFMCELLFRSSDYALIVSDTERQAGLFLSDVTMELTTNDDLIQMFGVSKFVKESATDIIVEMKDGHQFRASAFGAEQRLRGLKWKHKRPNLIVVDDLEDDTAVTSKERRVKLSHWFYSALLPCLSTRGKIRVVGTILHLDSLLESLLSDDNWLSDRFQAHTPTFRTILWPERWPKARLKKKRKEYVMRGIPEIYSREYLNWPIDDETAFFRKIDFHAVKFKLPRHPIYYAAADLAITKKETSDYTAIAVCCLDDENRVLVVDMVRGRWDSLEIIDHLFAVQVKYKPAIFTIESDKIQKSLGPIINLEMRRRGIYINMNPINPTTDKLVRAQSFNARMKAAGVFFNEKADWFPDCQNELLLFPRGKHDDQVDALSWIGLTLDKFQSAMTEEEAIDTKYDTQAFEDSYYYGGNNACYDTGY